ncbi:16S rRNA (guanine(966)-N(2))-methyltransferase RsmD [Arthrobacter monumenti]
MSRIIAGAAGGTRLFSVPGDGTRPTTDRVKEALFSRLESYNVISDARVLDLFSGSGSLGVESASRGAHLAHLVEMDARAADVCQRNADIVNKVLGSSVVKVHRTKVESFLQRESAGGWNLVFIDPPYGLSQSKLGHILEYLVPHLAEESVVVVERSARSAEPGWPDGLEWFSSKKYGETQLWFAEPAY